MAVYVQVESASDSHREDILGREGNTDRRARTTVDRHFLSVRVAEQRLSKQREARSAVRKTRTSHVGEDLSVSADIASRAAGLSERQGVGVVSGKVPDDPEIGVEVDCEVGVASLDIGDSIRGAHRRRQDIRVTQKELKSGKIPRFA